MTTKTTQLAQNIKPDVRMYVESALDDLLLILSARMKAEHENNVANHKALLQELGEINAKLNTVNSLIETDPSHKITKAKIIAIAKELNL